MAGIETIVAAELHGDEPELTAGRAMRVAAALKRKGGDEFAKPGNLVEVKFVKGQSLSLTASRLLALMILTAGSDAWQPIRHKMRKADIRRGHKSNDRIVDMLNELHSVLFAVDDKSWRGAKATRRFSLLQNSWEEAEDAEGSETGWIEWEFTPDARRLIQESETYAVLNRQAVLGFRSAYALKLYEMGALRIHRRQTTWRGDMTALRAALGIAPEIYKDFAQLRRKVLLVAKAEIDQLAHFKMEWREIRQGRAVAEVEIIFLAKDAPEQIETVAELDRHSAGRNARRDRTAELIVGPMAIPSERPKAKKGRPFAQFPAGTLRYGAEEFAVIATGKGGGWDRDIIASAYRATMGDRLAKLSGAKLEKSWTGFCESYASRHGKP
jgi:Initiator Replication protein